VVTCSGFGGVAAMKTAEGAIVVYRTGERDPVGWKHRRAVIEWERAVRGRDD
jgi:hypothetical protein